MKTDGHNYPNDTWKQSELCSTYRITMNVTIANTNWFRSIILVVENSQTTLPLVTWLSVTMNNSQEGFQAKLNTCNLTSVVKVIHSQKIHWVSKPGKKYFLCVCVCEGVCRLKFWAQRKSSSGDIKNSFKIEDNSFRCCCCCSWLFYSF